MGPFHVIESKKKKKPNQKNVVSRAEPRPVSPAAAISRADALGKVAKGKEGRKEGSWTGGAAATAMEDEMPKTL